MDDWGLNPATLEAVGTALAAVLAGLALWAARKALGAEQAFTQKLAADQQAASAALAERDQELRERLIEIEERRDRPRMIVLPNLAQETEGEPQLAITVLNAGTVVCGPVWPAVYSADGSQLSYYNADPALLHPGQAQTFVLGFLGEVPATYDEARRGGSDVPESLNSGQWMPARLNSGVHVRAWDPMWRQDAWYPEPLAPAPQGPPLEPL